MWFPSNCTIYRCKFGVTLEIQDSKYAPGSCQPHKDGIFLVDIFPSLPKVLFLSGSVTVVAGRYRRPAAAFLVLLDLY